ncbi:uncharacterized protein PITG_01137 [Phytophthora infestans T30-4]|uniref:Sfi1 spindle body domain-containing protein n=1 Tax=Phytophthora infestans (strain T30-4) TaxID=403677 RepID=D0MSK0_PHYIT|nr:uncharacterized protein PITG_01137 [Phytophthora infestans T30-4]EEY58469.1 conserved hypothetical protein [Phytophthora infestans T30-4]|eukprot:XP_002909655.1 conserved hypothetical protein [Phytophthora infestans T30-4]
MAENFYNEYLTCLAIYHWQEKWSQRSTQRHKEVAVTRQILARRLARAVFRWDNNSKHRSRLRAKKAKAYQFCMERVSSKCFGLWKNYLRAVRQKVSKRRFVSQLQQQKLLLRMFQRWQQFSEIRTFHRAQSKIADQHRSKFLRRLTFRGWKGYRSKRTLYILAYTYRRRLLLRTFWTRWERRREPSTPRQKRRVVSHFVLAHAVILRKWSTYGQTRVERRAKADLASLFKKTKLQAKAWRSWLRYTTYCHGEQQQLEWALSYYSVEVLLRRALTSWKKLVEKGDAFSRWEKYLRRRQVNNENKLQARVFHCIHVELSVLRVLGTFVRGRKQKEVAIALNKAKILCRAFTFWKRRAHVLRQMRNMILYQESFRVQTHLDAWKRFVVATRQMSERLRRTTKRKEKLRKVGVWQKWSIWVSAKRQERATIALAVCDFSPERFSKCGKNELQTGNVNGFAQLELCFSGKRPSCLEVSDCFIIGDNQD